MTILAEIDDLYERAVTDPASLNDQAFADWTEGVASGFEIDRSAAKYVRRCLNAGRKLAAFWESHGSSPDDPETWQGRVDFSLGVRAWRPQLDLAMLVLESDPDEESYARAVELFRLVHHEPFLDGMSYDEWHGQRHK
ncbi:MAG: hypothetical protein ABFR95_09990 [Actinomycetota bacterium]